MVSACRSRRHDVDSRRVSELLAEYRIPSAVSGVLHDGEIAEFAAGVNDITAGRSDDRHHLRVRLNEQDVDRAGPYAAASSLMVCPFVDAAGLVGDVEGLPHGSCRPRGLVPSGRNSPAIELESTSLVPGGRTRRSPP